MSKFIDVVICSMVLGASIYIYVVFSRYRRAVRLYMDQPRPTSTFHKPTNIVRAFTVMIDTTLNKNNNSVLYILNDTLDANSLRQTATIFLDPKDLLRDTYVIHSNYVNVLSSMEVVSRYTLMRFKPIDIVIPLAKEKSSGHVYDASLPGTYVVTLLMYKADKS